MFRSLRLKFTTWYVVISVLAALVVGAGIFYAESRALAHRLEGTIRGAGDAARAATAANMQRSLTGAPLDAATEAVNTVAEHRGLYANDVLLVLLDENGFVVANPENVDALALGRGGSIETARTRGEHWHDAHVSGTELRVKTSPLTDSNGELIGFVQAAKSTEDNRAALRTLVLVMTGSGLAGLVIFAVGGYIVAGKAIEPVRQGYERQRQFVADASHELRTPITVIRTNTEVLLRKEHDPAIDDIATEATYMSRLIDNLLSLASADRRTFHAGAQPVDLSAVARSAGRSAEALAQMNRLSFRQELEDGVVVEGDADACREAIFILLDNAMKYTPSDGEVVLSIRREGEDGIVTVRDNGIGMTAAELSHATDRFFSGDRARSRSGGAGLGLSIAEGLMAAMNGDLDIQSEPGDGTTVSLRLRLVRQPEARRPGKARTAVQRILGIPLGGNQKHGLP